MNEIEKKQIDNLFEFCKTFIGKLLVRRPFSGINNPSKAPYMLIKDVDSSEGLQWIGVWRDPIDEEEYFTRRVINEAEPFMLLSIEINNAGRQDYRLNLWFQILQNDIIGWVKPVESFAVYFPGKPSKEFVDKYEIFTLSL